MNKMNLVFLVSGIALGIALVMLWKAPVQSPSWQMGAVQGQHDPIAWRLNTMNGALELCAAFSSDGPKCLLMPKPSN